MDAAAKIMIADPRLPQFRLQVPDTWIDGNNHMNACFYLAAVKDAAIAVHESWDYADAFRARTGETNFVLESQVVHLRELMLGDHLLVSARIAEMDDRRMRLVFEIFNETEAYLAALAQFIVVHIRFGPPPKTAAMPEDLRRSLEGVHAMHRQVAEPEGWRQLKTLDLARSMRGARA
ncbi:acyl-CoA thioesterase FadM [Rhodoligotrophos appendicifer]|uniref:acyl-CoA thioesterase n=1 Tax=Rhodoligotrophos appendicifer TaxID=987056 RepID=UPI0011863A45|nr:thioesterase family protein [Rhodoligotrophos appendicifer]